MSDALSSGEPVLSRTVTICNKRGLHARAAARFVTLAEQFGASIDVLKDGVDSRYFVRGGFAEINAEKIIVLADEAIPFAEFDLQVLDQRIKDTEEDLIAAKDDDARARITESLDDLRMIRAAF